jgi:enterochelin esterase-like enzyme
MFYEKFLLKNKLLLFLRVILLILNTFFVAHAQVTVQQNLKIQSKFLQREVTFIVVMPPDYFNQKGEKYKVLYMNDGQDFEALKLESTLNNLYTKKEIESFILVAVYSSDNRLQEYGTAAMPDYQGRGSLAKKYNSFIIKELMPALKEDFNVKEGFENTFFMGFSLGGLSAMDIVWENPKYFSKVGVFSGSFWWRKKAYESGYVEDKDRIMHNLVRDGKFHEGQKFWFECGTDDEKDDRNHNGIIDSIDDTQDLIKELVKKGYRQNTDIQYYEVQGGQHNQATWSKALPVFLKWLLPKKL